MSKFSNTDSADVTVNSLSRKIKHLYIPSFIGLFGGLTMAYLNNINVEGFFKSCVSLATGNHFTISGTKLVPEIIDGEKIERLKDVSYSYTSTQGFNYFPTKIWEDIVDISIWFSAGFTLTAVSSFVAYMYISKKYSKNFLEDTILRGSKILTEKQYDKLQKKEKIKGAMIGNTAMIDEMTEMGHGLVIGSSRTGKSVALKRFFSFLISNRPNSRILINDSKSELIEELYDPETDIIYSLGDKRTHIINIFSLIKIHDNGTFSEADVRKVCEIVMPRPKGEAPVWTDNPRIVLYAILIYLIQEVHFNQKKKIGNNDVTELITLAGLSTSMLVNKLGTVYGTETAIGILTNGNDEQVGIFVSSFITKAQYFTNLPKAKDIKELDVGKWISTKGQSTIFISNGEQTSEDEYGMRVAVLIEAVVSEMKKLGDDPYKNESPASGNRRTVYMILDEFGSLPKMTQFITFMAEAAGLGGSAWLYIQEYSRIVDKYGEALATTIINNCSTKFIFRVQDPDTQNKASTMIGDVEKESTSMTNSTGAKVDATKEGSTFNRTSKTEKAVLPADIGNLPNNHFYMKNAEKPWVKIETEWLKERDYYPKKNKRYVERKLTREEQFGLTEKKDSDVDLKETKEPVAPKKEIKATSEDESW